MLPTTDLVREPGQGCGTVRGSTDCGQCPQVGAGVDRQRQLAERGGGRKVHIRRSSIGAEYANT